MEGNSQQCCGDSTDFIATRGLAQTCNTWSGKVCKLYKTAYDRLEQKFARIELCEVCDFNFSKKLIKSDFCQK